MTTTTLPAVRDPRIDAALDVAEAWLARMEGKQHRPVTHQEMAAFAVIVCAHQAPRPPGSPFGPGPAEAWAAEFRTDTEILP